MLLLRFAFYQNNILAETQHEFAYFHRGSKKTFRKIVEHQVICLYLWIIGSQTVQFVLANSLLFILNKTASEILSSWVQECSPHPLKQHVSSICEPLKQMMKMYLSVAAWWARREKSICIKTRKLWPPGGWWRDWFVYRDSASCPLSIQCTFDGFVPTQGVLQWILQVAVPCSNSAELT